MNVRFEHVSKVYPGSEYAAVNDVSLTVPKGHFVVLLGPSGCGKTTVLKMTNRLIEPSAGKILLDEVDARAMDVTALRRQIGYVIQQVGLFPHMTVAENVGVVPSLMKWSKARTAERVDELLELVHLPPGEFRGRYPAQLSGGQQQRVGLARALAADPDLLLMDEPFGAIDAITRESLQDEMLDLHRRLHKTILFVTHDVEEALRLADRIAMLHAGRLVQYGAPCDLLRRPANDFVRDLLGADDPLRQMGLARVESVMVPLPANTPAEGPRLAAESSLREALGLFLQPGVRQVVVVRGDQPVGVVTFEQLKEMGCDGVGFNSDKSDKDG